MKKENENLSDVEKVNPEIDPETLDDYNAEHTDVEVPET